MADYNLLLVAIPEDTRKSEPTNQKTKLKTLLCYDFYTRFRPQLLTDISPQIFLTFRARKIGIVVLIWTTVTWTCFDQRYFYLACELSKVN